MTANNISRRALLLGSVGAALAKPAPADDKFLDDLAHRSFQYFWEYTDPNTGMTAGRCHASGEPYDPNRRDIGSIAVTGFGLAGLCAAAERKWVKHDEALTRARNTMRFFADHAPQEHGWFFHWMNIKTGERTGVLQNSPKKSELSSIDTALLMGGILTAKQYFKKDAEIQKLATKLYERMDFQWMLNGDPLLLSHGWNPEDGFLKSRWARYSEFTIIYLLAIGSPTNPINPESWYAWERIPRQLWRLQVHRHLAALHAPVLASLRRLPQPPRNPRHQDRLVRKFGDGHQGPSPVLYGSSQRIPRLFREYLGHYQFQ